MMNEITRLFVLLLVGLGLSANHAAAGEWPENYMVSEDTISPDGRYGLVIPAEDATGEPVNYLADLKEKRLLGKITGCEYYQNEKRRSLLAFWSPDSRWCVVEYANRYDFGSIFVLELAGRNFVQTDAGKHVKKALDAAILRQSRVQKGGGGSSAWFRLGLGRMLRVRATVALNRWKIDDEPKFYAAFAGTFDLKTRRWLVSGTRRINAKDDEAMSIAYADIGTRGIVLLSEDEENPQDYRGEVCTTEEERTEKLEGMLNGVYRIVRLTLPPARFAAVKAEQVAWLKQRDALSSAPEKSKLTFARIKALQDLAW